MDSGNSGSVQSSSGGGGGDQDEYDSRTQTLAALFNPTTATTSTTARFIPPTSQNHFNADPDDRWATTMRSEPNSSRTVGSDVLPRAPEIAAVTGNRIPPARNPKKRSRASRRAPTTVLTTDTTNFRAMVQEFTGIPSPPFSSSPFVRNRLDLFGTPSGIRSSLLDPTVPLPPLPYRPSPQKFQPPPLQQVDHLSLPFANNTGAPTSSSPTYQLPPPPPISGMQNTILTFQNLHQPPPKFDDEFGSGQTQLNDLLPSLVSSEGAHHHHHPPRGNTDQTNWTDGGDRINENVRNINRRGGGGGGMVESWLCSTD